jgi:ETC complex I subunit conserved region
MPASKSNRPTPTFSGSVFPSDAVARIFRPARSALTSGKARTKSWVLRFDRRTPPVIEPLMGWTGGDDTLIQVELTFPTREAAVAYAERQGLTFVIEGHDSAARVPDPRATNKPCVAEHSSQRTLPANLSLARMQARRDPCNLSKTPDLKRALVNHAAVFRAPREIVGQSSFEHRLQAGTLTRWA